MLKWCSAEYKKGYSASSPAVQPCLASSVLLNLMAAWCLMGHGVPKCVDWNLGRSLHWSVFVTLGYKSSSSSYNSPVAASKDSFRLPEARGDSGHVCVAWWRVLRCVVASPALRLVKSHSSAPAVPRAVMSPSCSCSAPGDGDSGWARCLPTHLPAGLLRSLSLPKFL